MVKTEFSIKDLENLSDVKAHTIRIWEKRYNLLEPNRTDTNIRRYDLENLKKLLNISYLYKEGHKISKLAGMTPIQIQGLIEKDAENHSETYNLEVFKSCMLQFDGEGFDTTFESLLKKKSFDNIYTHIFIPLLNSTGVLWHTGTIDPSHEHFISEKIKHALINQASLVKNQQKLKEHPLFVLYLPTEEIHEISLLYAYYTILSQGYSPLYLGANTPMESLRSVQKQKPDSIFVSNFTVQPETESLKNYIENFQNTLGPKTELWLLGKRCGQIIKNEKNIRIFEEIDSFQQHLQSIS